MAGRSRAGSGLWSLAALALASALFAAPSTALAATCTVTNTADYNPTTDPVITNTLRWCVEVIGNNDSTATDVGFNFTSGSGPWEIDVEYFLHITETDTSIDGSTQSGYTSVTPSSSGSYGVILDGSANGSAPLILIDGAGAEIRALRIKDHEAAAPPGPPPHAIQVAANGATIAQNRLEDCSGGVAVFEDVENTLIGGSSSTEGNVIAATTNSDGIILIEVGTGNVVQHNVIDQAYGSGIFALESAVSTGLAALITIDDNTVTYSGGDGYVIFDSRASLEGNYSDDNTGAGFVLADFADVTDRMLVRDNYSRSNGADGVAVLGAEVSLWNNVITGNGAFGVVLATMLGDDPSPDGTGPDDDTLAGGEIGSHTVGADENQIGSNTGGGIFLLDATIDNIDTVEEDNALTSNGDLEVAQFWPVLVQVDSMWEEPYEGVTVEVWPTGGPEEEEEPLVEGESDAAGFIFDPDDAETWSLVPGFVVFNDGGLTRFDLSPHEIVSTTPGGMDRIGFYAWNGAEDGVGKSVECEEPCRYQVFEEVMAPDCGGLELACDPTPREITIGTGPGAVTRYYVVCPAAPEADRPLVVGLHGGGLLADAESLDRVGGCRMLELADRDNFVLAFPRSLVVDDTPEFDPIGAGVEFGWNDCRQDRRDLGSGEGEIDADPDQFEDLEFIRKVIVAVQTDEETDPDRTYVWGHSNGATMALRIATEFDPLSTAPVYPDIQAVASNRGNEPLPTTSGGITAVNECTTDPKSGADVLFMAGTEDDNWMPFAGGAALDDPDRGYVRGAEDTFSSEPSTVAWWTTELGATTAGPSFTFYSKPGFEDGPPPGDDSVATVTTYTDGTWNGPRVRYYKVDGGGHTMPGYQPQLFGNPEPEDFCDGGLFGCASADFNGIDEIWNFFQPRSLLSSFSGSSPYGFTSVIDEGDPSPHIDVQAGFDLDGSGSGLEVTVEYTESAYFLHQYANPATQSRVRFWIDPSYVTLPTGAHPVHHVSVICGVVPVGSGTRAMTGSCG